MDISQSLSNGISVLQMAAASMRLNDIFEAHPEAMQAFQDWQNAILADLDAKHGNVITPAARIVAYRKAVGDEVFNALAANPNLQAMADEHFRGITVNAINEALRNLPPSLTDLGITAADVKAMFALAI